MQLHFLYLYYTTAATPSLPTEMLTHSPRRCVPHCRDCSPKGLCDKAPHRRQGLFCDETAGLGVPILCPLWPSPQRFFPPEPLQHGSSARLPLSLGSRALTNLSEKAHSPDG